MSDVYRSIPEDWAPHDDEVQVPRVQSVQAEDYFRPIRHLMQRLRSQLPFGTGFKLQERPDGDVDVYITHEDHEEIGRSILSLELFEYGSFKEQLQLVNCTALAADRDLTKQVLQSLRATPVPKATQ